MLNNIYFSTLYKNILPNPDFRTQFGTKIFVPKFSFQSVIFIKLSLQMVHKVIINAYLMHLSIVLWFVMVSEQFEQKFQNMLLLRSIFRAIPLKRETYMLRIRGCLQMAVVSSSVESRKNPADLYPV